MKLGSKYSYYFTLFILTTFSLTAAYLLLPDYFQSLDARVRDFYFKVRGSQAVDTNIIIVDIDEKSMKSLGQWPWERDKIAKIIQNLSAAGAGIIGLDIVFSEADKTSPKHFATKFHLQRDDVIDYDAILANTIASTPTILGYVFDFDENNGKEAPVIPAIFIQKHKTTQEFLPKAKGVLPNVSIIQNAAYSSGFINNIPDDSGIIRSVPLLIMYDMQIYPSLAFEMYRIAMNENRIVIGYSSEGISTVKVGETPIKTDRFGRLYLNFKGPFRSYTYFSALDIYKNNFNKKDVQGKFIFIGTSAYGLMDLRSTPMDSVIAGVEIHANTLDNLLHNDMLYKPSWIEAADILVIVGSAFFIFFIFSQFSLFWMLLSYVIFVMGLFIFTYSMLFQWHIIINVIFPFFTMIFSLIGVLAVKYIFEFRQKEIIKRSFSKKVSKQVMEDLLQHPNRADMTSKELDVSIYFSDIRSFTTISEQLGNPHKIVSFLNEYMDAMVRVIEKNSGTIDKFIGDAVMAYWNAPLSVEQHADKAVQTALEQINMREHLNIAIQKKYGFDVDYGIGINSGEVVVGEVGSKGRSDYTIIGDSVNLASRLEGLCKVYKVRLVISEFTKEKLQETYVIQFLDRVKVKGKKKPVKIYEVLSLGEANKVQKQEFSIYEMAYSLYLEANFTEAQKVFEELYTQNQKYLYKLYAQRCQHLQNQNIQIFDGVYTFTTK